MAGVFVVLTLLGVVAFVVGAAIQNRWLEQRISFYTVAVRGDGIAEGTPVLLSGIEVGEVGDLSILPDNRIHVEILVRERHAGRVRVGSKAEIRRMLGIGEKRIHLVTKDVPKDAPALPPGAMLPADELVDLLDAISRVDIGQYLQTLDRAVSTLELTIKKLEEDQRLERMMEAFDHMGPTMQKMSAFIDDVDEPLVALISDPEVKKTFRGASRVFNDPNTRRAMRSVSETMEAERKAELFERMDAVFTKLEPLMEKDGHFTGAMAGADKVFNDERLERIMASFDKMSRGEKLDTLANNLSKLTAHMAAMSPQIPAISKELLVTLRETTVVLKALQRTWLLDDESEEVRREQKREKDKEKGKKGSLKETRK